MSIMRNYRTRGRNRAYVEIEQDGGVGGREERERERGGAGGRGGEKQRVIESTTVTMAPIGAAVCT